MASSGQLKTHSGSGFVVPLVLGLGSTRPGSEALRAGPASGDPEGFKRLPRAAGPAYSGQRFRPGHGRQALPVPIRACGYYRSHVAKHRSSVPTAAKAGSAPPPEPASASSRAPLVLAGRKSAGPPEPDDAWIRRHLQVPMSGEGPVPRLLEARIRQSLKRVSLSGWAGPGLDRAERRLTNIHRSEGLAAIVDIVRRAPAFAALGDSHVSFDKVPSRDPGGVRVLWAEGRHAALSERVLAGAGEDPFRTLDVLLPVGTVFDVRDAALEAEIRESELFHLMYQGDLSCSSLGAIVERSGGHTWTLTLWHRITDPARRLAVRSSLARLARALRVACWRIGLFGDPEIEVAQPEALAMRPGEAGRLSGTPPSSHSSSSLSLSALMPGTARPRSSRRGLAAARGFAAGRPAQERLGPAEAEREIGLASKGPSGKLGPAPNPYPVPQAPPPLSEWSDRALEAQAEILRGDVERRRDALRRVEEERKARLGFAGAVPVSEFKAKAVHLVRGFEADPRPWVIYVSGTDRTCILKPVDPENLPEKAIPVSRMGQHGSRLVQMASESSGAHGGACIGIRQGGVHSGRVVAALCPPNGLSRAYIGVLCSLGELE